MTTAVGQALDEFGSLGATIVDNEELEHIQPEIDSTIIEGHHAFTTIMNAIITTEKTPLAKKR